ncbi:glycosyltransferase family 2 protein [Nonomuraea gerenzanensis]|uniref:HAD-superfamily hydrolase subfamily IIIA n=1 Tax=Nonomuraea gerenzanensis TaxID=93944 RepID=A0A1M4EH43_9ACTN|nr:glycosyltransferase family 2 protein [Nonomuraea gerenzanensis]UBU09625.1 glycosyltransferase family 2 protein [Nonomuraea gerenzanensis]SBO98056.1 HAD-superfamily hydrolase subfamily IIIA [Nonomuraea gerenzanensis]
MITVVIPTIGRPTLRDTLAAVGPGVPVIVVDDRALATEQEGGTRTAPPLLAEPPPHVRVVRSGGRGPAAARNAGWRAADTPWVVFLDDDVIPAQGWAEAVWKDLVDLPDDVAGSQGRIVVPLPADRRPTDGERHTAGLTGALWVTADMAYRRSALEAVGGFDERFPRAYREDADLALRVTRAGHRLVRGERVTEHPVRADGFWASVRFQRGNADDALMRRLHGPSWRADIGGGRGRLRLHALTTAAGLAALLLGTAAATGARTKVTALGAGAAWAALTAEFAWRRIAPGPRTPLEVLRMAVTSVLIPPVACAHRLRGEWRVRR